MTRQTTPVEIRDLPFSLRPGEAVAVFGSCLASSLGDELAARGIEVMVNPFGTLYNPISVMGALARLDSGSPFGPEDCAEMGAGAGLICSFEHYTKFARPTAEEFLDNANAALRAAAALWTRCTKVVVILYSARVWERGGRVVANCLKRPAREFDHRMLSVDEVRDSIRRIIADHPGKEFVFMVCPIRQMGEGAHLNTISKSTLHLGIEAAGAEYFPAYEIAVDELRDYRYFADDLVHPSDEALSIIWKRFTDICLKN